MCHVRYPSIRGVLVSVWLSILCVAALSNPLTSIAQPPECSAAFLIDVTLANGARWSMCWEERANEGIVFYDVYHTPPGNPSSLIFFQMGLAEVHVPYDDNSERFFEVSQSGFGGVNLQHLEAGDCPGGTLLQNTRGKSVLCHTITDEGYAFKYFSITKQATALTLFSVSVIGEYNYVVHWKFHDDGTVEPSVGATGRLVGCTTNPDFGWPLGSDCGGGTLGTSHTHNFWWRLDIDLDGAPDDRVQAIQFSGSGSATRPMQLASPITEVQVKVLPTAFRSFRVVDTFTTNTDGHRISYELVPEPSQQFRGPSTEPWTQYDFYLTQHNDCEQLLTHNPTTGGCGEDVTQFVNNETVTDVVLWYGTSFHHLPRDEDESNMSIHWSGFQMVPRDMTATNPR